MPAEPSLLPQHCPLSQVVPAGTRTQLDCVSELGFSSPTLITEHPHELFLPSGVVLPGENLLRPRGGMQVQCQLSKPLSALPVANFTSCLAKETKDFVAEPRLNFSLLPPPQLKEKNLITHRPASCDQEMKNTLCSLPPLQPSSPRLHSGQVRTAEIPGDFSQPPL